MAFIDCVRWTPKDGEFIFAYRYPETNLSTHTQLIVHESQEALLFSKGQLMGKFGPGKHTLDTENLPLLRSLFGLPFGGKNPFTAEVWFVNKLYPTNLTWEVNKITIHDADYNTMIPLQASGQYGVKVEDSERFLVKMVGTKAIFTESDMLDNAFGEFASKSKSAIIQFMNNNNIGFKRVSAHLDSLSEYIKSIITPYWADYGMSFTRFYLNEISIDESTAEGKKLARAVADQAEMSITGHSWQQKQMFDLTNNAVDQMGEMSGTNGLLAGMMAMNMMGGGMMGGGGGMSAGMMQTQYNQPNFNSYQQNQQGSFVPPGQQQMGQVREVYCASCAKKHLTTERFCPHCGAEYNPCPKCGSDNMKGAKRCISCGTPLQMAGGGSACTSCGAPLMPGAAFCPSCGQKQNSAAAGNVCPRCKTALAPNTRFCPTCGNKM